MLHLLLPALIPSWRFFDRIGPAPRIEFAITERQDDKTPQWREVRPRPQQVSVGKMLVRLLWNRRRNEALYLVSCAERLVEDPTEWRATELWQRAADMVRDDPHSASRRTRDEMEAGRAGGSARTNAAPEGGSPRRQAAPSWLRVRIVESMRDGSRMEHEVVYESGARPFDDFVAEASE